VRRRPLRLSIQVAIGVEVVAQDAAEQHQFTDVMALAERRERVVGDGERGSEGWVGDESSEVRDQYDYPFLPLGIS
jgi:hypothetical protein